MIFQSKSLLATTAIVGCSITSSLFDTADAHGYLKTPRSRNWYAYEEAVWWDVKDTDPLQESDPYSANRGGTAAQCGIIIDRNYDLPKNAKDGGLLKPVIQECYEEGSVIDVEVTLTAYHGGHFEFYACPISWGEVPTEACFKAHPLEFVEDVLHGAPKDPNYPTRAYIHGLSQMSFGNFHYKYKLPTGLLGELVLIQWYYVTGNTCTDEGYADYAFNAAAGFVNYNPEQTATCPLPITGDGSEAPERFWNCAEVRVTEDCSITTTTTTTPPTVCTPISQEELGYSVTAVSQESCNKCALNNVESTYWPCDSNPPLCDCHQESTGSTTTTQAATTSTAATNAPETTTTTTATSETTTTTPETTTTTTTENSPTTSTFATAPIPSPTAPNQITCRAVTAEEFEAKNENPNSATTDDLCAQCAPPPAGTDYQWWPCNTASPALCVCGGSTGTTTEATETTTTTTATTTSTEAPETTETTTTTTATTTSTEAPETTETTTTTTTTTTENSPTTSSPTTSNQITTCRAVTAEEFEAKNENPNSATTDDLCAKCAPPPAGTDYQWWPCNTASPALCVCGGSTGSTTEATSTSTAAPEETTTTTTATTTSTTTSTNGQTSTTTTVSTGGRTCRAKTKEEISTNEWPVTDETCKVCEGPYDWWPCASNNDLCHCE